MPTLDQSMSLSALQIVTHFAIKLINWLIDWLINYLKGVHLILQKFYEVGHIIISMLQTVELRHLPKAI